MSVNSTEFNKHWPEDFYPLPFIDQNITTISGYEVLNFLKLYSKDIIRC